MANYSICTQTFDIGDEPKAKALKPLDLFQCKVLERAPEWDGHTPAQAIERINSLKRVLVAERFGDGFEVGE